MHPLVSALRQAKRGAMPRALFRGLSLPIQSARVLIAHRRLWALAIVPALIHGALLVGAIVLVFTYADVAATWLWAPPAADSLWTGALRAMWYGLYALIIVAGLITGYAATLLVSGVVASPFNDALSERAEELLRDDDTPEPASTRPFWREALSSLRATLLILVLYLTLMVPVVLLNLLPGVGNVAATVLGTGIGAFFLALEFTDITLARHGYRLRQKLRLLRAHPGLTAGFGLGTSLLLWIPLLNILCVPIAVVGGTALALALLDDEASSRAAG